MKTIDVHAFLSESTIERHTLEQWIEWRWIVAAASARFELSEADAARAIMTTDTFPKGASAEIEGEGGPIRIAGIAKGSGMIAPDMATMLVYVFTDARIAPELLQRILNGQLAGTSWFAPYRLDIGELHLFAGGQSRRGRPGERLGRAFERLGPVAIKLGQLLATRADVFGERFADDLGHRCDGLIHPSNRVPSAIWRPA